MQNVIMVIGCGKIDFYCCLLKLLDLNEMYVRVFVSLSCTVENLKIRFLPNLLHNVLLMHLSYTEFGTNLNDLCSME